ncbi:TPA: HipA domain-containing protein [Vibrio parahaemolyticus]|nr:HipA domain-containing protein [Vibrio parahaemolyticus]
MTDTPPLEYYPIIDISDQDIDEFEQMGTKSKFWYKDSQTGIDYLFKSIHTEDGNGNPIQRKGEDWAEKIACEIAALLGVPHAIYELATHKGERGIRSEKFTLEGENMFFGNQLIEHVVNTINATLESGQRSQTVSRVSLIMEQLVKHPPKGWVETENIKTALDVFIGYLLLDVLISNQDRHNENWAMIVSGNTINLAPSFDHAASLGRNESVENMQRRLTSKDNGQKIPTYVSKSKSWFYYKDKRLKTLDAFLHIGYIRKDAALEWLSKLEAITTEQLINVVVRVPKSIMCETEKAFCASILVANKARILVYKDLFKN